MKIKKPISCQECKILDCAILKNCSSDWLDYINTSKICFRVKKGDIIFYEGDIIEGMRFIQEGKIKVFKTGINSREQIVRLSKTGDILGHRGWERNKMPVSASAIENSTICFVNNNDFSNALKHNAKLTYDLMLFYANELYFSEVKARNLAQMSVTELVADALLYIHQVYGEDSEGFLDVRLSRQEIADLSGTTKEQVSKFLSEFNEDGIIITNKKAIKILSANRLREISQKYLLEQS